MTQNKMLVMIQKLYFYEVSMLEYSTGVRFSGVKDFAKVTQGSAGIQDFDTHAPCWNQVKMCVQINFFSFHLLRIPCWNSVFFFLKYWYHECEISVKKILYFSG